MLYKNFYAVGLHTKRAIDQNLIIDVSTITTSAETGTTIRWQHSCRPIRHVSDKRSEVRGISALGRKRKPVTYNGYRKHDHPVHPSIPSREVSHFTRRLNLLTPINSALDQIIRMINWQEHHTHMTLYLGIRRLSHGHPAAAAAAQSTDSNTTTRSVRLLTSTTDDIELNYWPPTALELLRLSNYKQQSPIISKHTELHRNHRRTYITVIDLYLHVSFQLLSPLMAVSIVTRNC